jgi:hypothetical protein
VNKTKTEMQSIEYFINNIKIGALALSSPAIRTNDNEVLFMKIITKVNCIDII